MAEATATEEKTLSEVVASNEKPALEFEPVVIANPITGEVCESIDDLLQAADIYAAMIVNAKTQIDAIKVKTWEMSGGDDPTLSKTRHLQGETFSAKLEAAPKKWNASKLRSALETWRGADGPVGKIAQDLIVPDGYRLAMAKWGMLQRTTTDDMGLKALIAEVKAAELVPGLPSLKIEIKK